MLSQTSYDKVGHIKIGVQKGKSSEKGGTNLLIDKEQEKIITNEVDRRTNTNRNKEVN